MKALANGVLNLSTLDGWWDEAWHIPGHGAEPVGWAIGKGEVYDNRDYQDQIEADALYELLERDVIPLFYDRRADGIPRLWIARMKSSIGTLCQFFNTHRMVRDYTEQFYLPARDNFAHLSRDSAAPARELTAWVARVRNAWSQVKIELLDPALPPAVSVGQAVDFRARVFAGPLKPEDLKVELYIGRLNAQGEIMNPERTVMKAGEAPGNTVWLYEAAGVSCGTSGLHGFTARVLPSHRDLKSEFVPGLVTWAAGTASVKSSH
jgi:starch phosphorylase